MFPNNTYHLQLTPAFRNVHPVFNATLLRRFDPDQIEEHPITEQPPPELDKQGEEAYEVEKILDSRYQRGRLQYLVQWKGYGPEHNTWEPEANVQNASRLVAQFHRFNPSAPQRISAATWGRLPFRRLENYTDAPPSLFNWEEGSTRRGAES